MITANSRLIFSMRGKYPMRRIPVFLVAFSVLLALHGQAGAQRVIKKQKGVIKKKQQAVVLQQRAVAAVVLQPVAPPAVNQTKEVAEDDAQILRNAKVENTAKGLLDYFRKRAALD